MMKESKELDTMRYLYAVFIDYKVPGKSWGCRWAMFTNKRQAVKLARKERGVVHRMPMPETRT